MENLEDNVFENFYSSVMVSLMEAARKNPDIRRVKATPRTVSLPSISDKIIALKKELTSDKDNRIKTLSIIHFLFSDSFIKYLIDRQKEQEAIVTEDRGHSFYELVKQYYDKARKGKLIPVSSATGEKDRQQQLEENRNRVTALLAFAYRSLDKNENGQLTGSLLPVLKKLVNKNDHSQDPSDGILTNPNTGKQYVIDLDSIRGSRVKKGKNQKVVSNYTILSDMYEYCRRIYENADAINELLETIEKVQKSVVDKTSEPELHKAFMNTDIGMVYTSADGQIQPSNSGAKKKDKKTKLTSFAEIDAASIEPQKQESPYMTRYIDTEKFYRYLVQIGIYPQKLKECAAFHKNIANQYYENISSYLGSAEEFEYKVHEMPDFEGFNPTELTQTNIISRLPDMSISNKIFQEEIATGATMNSLFNLGNMFDTVYKEVDGIIKANKDNHFDIDRYINAKYQQLHSLKIAENTKITSLMDLYKKIAKLFVFIKDEGLGDDALLAKERIIKIETPENPAEQALKALQITIAKAQNDLKTKIEQTPYYMHRVLDYCQSMAFDPTMKRRGENVFAGKTKSGTSLSLSLPTTDMFSLIDNEKARLSLLNIGTTDKGKDLFHAATEKQYSIPLSDDQATDAGTVAQDILNLLSSKTKPKAGSSGDVTIDLNLTDEAIEKFLSDASRKNIQIDTNDSYNIGDFVDDHMNSNVTIVFKSHLDTEFAMMSDKNSDENIRITITNYRKSYNRKDPKQGIVGKYVEVTVPMYTMDIGRLFSAAQRLTSATNSGTSILKLTLKSNYDYLSKGDDKTHLQKVEDGSRWETLLHNMIKASLLLLKQKYDESVFPDTASPAKKEMMATGTEQETNKAEKRQTADEKIANALFSQAKIDAFADMEKNNIYASPSDFATNDVNTNEERLFNDFCLLYPIILFRYILFNYNEYQSVAQVKAKKQAGGASTLYYPEDADTQFSDIFRITKSNLENIKNRSSIKSLSIKGSVLAATKEFGRVMNAISRTSSGVSPDYLRAQAAFNEITPLIRTLKGKNVDKKISEAFSDIVTTSQKSFMTSPETDVFIEGSLDFPVTFDCRTDTETASQTWLDYFRYLYEENKNNSVPVKYDEFFANRLQKTTEILKTQYKNVLQRQYTTDDEKILALSDVILYYYYICCLIYHILIINVNGEFANSDPNDWGTMENMRLRNSLVGPTEPEKSVSKYGRPNRKYVFKNTRKIGAGYVKNGSGTPPPAPAPTPPSPAPAPAPAPAPTPAPAPAPAPTPAPTPAPAPAPAPPPKKKHSLPPDFFTSFTPRPENAK